MKTVRVNMESFVKMMRVKHELELEKRDVVNMSDVMDVLMYRYEMLIDGMDPDEVKAVKFAFTDTADEVAKSIKPSDDDDEEEEEEKPAPKKRGRPPTRRPAAKRS